MSAKIPVTVLTGFLGSGKTTLLNRILSEEHGLRIAVIENEFGEIGIDQDLVINAEEEIFEMNNGCICCSVRGDLIRILGDLAKKKDKFDRVILETTGLADPGPVAQTFFVDEDIREEFTIDGIITLIDSKHVTQHLDENTDEVLAQIAFADRLILNKADLTSESDLEGLETRITNINNMAEMQRATMANAPIKDLLDIGGFNVDQALEVNPNFLEPEYPFEWGGIWELEAGEYRFLLQDGPDPDMAVLMVEADEVSEAEVMKLAEEVFVEFSKEETNISSGEYISQAGICYRIALEGNGLYEYKLNTQEPRKVAVFSQHTPEEFNMKLFNEKDEEISRSVDHYFDAGHEHDDSVTSVSVEFPGSFDMDKLSTWFKKFLAERGPDIYRMKGVLSVKGASKRIIFQGVHMLLGSNDGSKWGNAERYSRIVFIGKNLDEVEIRGALKGCLA